MASTGKNPAKPAKAKPRPMKWDERDNAILLTKLIETHNIKVDAQMISNAWPQESGSPSPRAIREQIGRIKSMKAKTKLYAISDETSAGDTDMSPPTITKRPCKRTLGIREPKPTTPVRNVKRRTDDFLHQALPKNLTQRSPENNGPSSDADRSAREDPDSDSDLI
ncbi:hypothetical protein N7486_008651 [Penicillium sp. IBT 16267x]|nr:hypothetical protein N7486_008651 [Penicillium sp. IBT 16267x]